MVDWLLRQGARCEGGIGWRLQERATALLPLVGAVPHRLEEGGTWSRALDLVPRHVCAVTSSRTQAQIASAALSSGL
jgi:hypothetical protein